MKTLTHNEQVKVNGAIWVQAITVQTLKGYCEKYCDYQQSLERAIKNGHDIAWTNLKALCITANYAGKDKDRANEMKAFENATVLIDGEQVIIEGDIYTVKVMGLHYCDPIHFIPVK